MHAYIHTYVYVCMCVYVCICIYMHVCMYICVYACMYMCVCMHNTYICLGGNVQGVNVLPKTRRGNCLGVNCPGGIVLHSVCSRPRSLWFLNSSTVCKRLNLRLKYLYHNISDYRILI